MASGEALLIFARYPRQGRVKTRLASRFDPPSILELYRAFLLDTLAWTARVPVTRYLFLADCTAEESASLASGDPLFEGIRLRRQEGDDLGERMWNAFETVWPASRSVVFLGADTPALPARLVRDGLRLLRRRPVVIGPSTDGGYYLLGLSAPLPVLFEEIDWGSPRVLEQTLGRLDEASYSLLPVQPDVDTPGDLEELRQELKQRPRAAPRTRRALEALAPA